MPALVGLCRDDVAGVSNMVNAAQRRLLYAKEANEESWWGTWSEMAFTGSQTLPYLTMPRDVARIEAATVCNSPIAIQNQFYEYLQFGNGRLPKNCHRLRGTCLTQAYTRNNVPTFVDPPTQPFYLQAFPIDPADAAAGNRVLFQGLDESGNVIYSQDAANLVTGEYVTLAMPFGSSTHLFSSITGIQKDPTTGQVQIMSVDATTGVSTLLLTMEPGEQTASYRRYYFDRLPKGCCALPGVVPQPVPITAIAKLELIPAQVDQDYLLIQNLEALTEECQSVRHSEIDGASAKQESRERHNAAIQLLNAELVHYLGKNEPAVNFKPFGSASFNRITRGFI
jgi:hypothetical protein